jgi:uncharacterized protein
MSQTLNLYRLQQIDLQIDRIQARLEIIQTGLDDNTELGQSIEAVKAAETNCLAANQSLVEAEKDVKNQQVKIDQAQSSLYGAKSHSPKELQDLQNDVASLKRHLVTLEDRQFEAMLACETAEANLNAEQINFEKICRERESFEKGLVQEQGGLRKDLDRLSVERFAVAGSIPANELGLYDQLRHQRRGIAVAVIRENSCEACGSTLSLAQMQSARSSGEMTLCPSCGRILFGN